MKSLVESLLLLGVCGLARLLFFSNRALGQAIAKWAIIALTMIFVVMTAFKLGQLEIMICNDEISTGMTKTLKFVKGNCNYIPICVAIIGVLLLLYYLSKRSDKTS